MLPTRPGHWLLKLIVQVGTSLILMGTASAGLPLSKCGDDAIVAVEVTRHIITAHHYTTQHSTTPQDRCGLVIRGSYGNVMLYPNVYGPRCIGLFGMPHPGYDEGFWNNTVLSDARVCFSLFCLFLSLKTVRYIYNVCLIV